MKAVILAGGKGKRLKPLTDNLPKPMIDVAGKPLLEHQLILFRKYGITKIIVCSHYISEKIESYFGAITGQEDCDEQKPSPKPVLVTLEKLRVKPPEAIYVGDMEEDIIAGKRARTCTVAISRKGSYHPLWRLKRQNPDCIISNLGDLFVLFKGGCA